MVIALILIAAVGLFLMFLFTLKGWAEFYKGRIARAYALMTFGIVVGWGAIFLPIWLALMI